MDRPPAVHRRAKVPIAANVRFAKMAWSFLRSRVIGATAPAVRDVLDG